MSRSVPHDAPSPRFGGLLAILGTLSALGPLSIDMYLPSFPSIAAAFGTDVAAVQLTLASYLGGLAIGQFAYGPLSDRFGRRPPLLGGLALYTLASLVCAVAPSLPVLAGGRLLQALGGCAGMVVSRAAVRDRFDETTSARFYASLMLVMGAAPILAPLLGAQVLGLTGWRGIFGALAAFGALTFAVVAIGLPESLRPERRARDGVLAILRTTGAVLGDRRFLALAVAGASMQAAMFAYISGSPFVFIELFHVPEDRFGVLFGANAFGLIAASQTNRWLAPRFGALNVLRGAVAVGAGAFLTLLAAALAGGTLPMLMVPLFFGMSSLGLVLPNVTAVTMGPFGRSAGIASALLGTFQMAAGALAAAVVSGLADGTAAPMAGVMGACGAGALALIAGDALLTRRAA